MAVARAPSSVALRSSASATAPLDARRVGEHQAAVAASRARRRGSRRGARPRPWPCGRRSASRPPAGGHRPPCARCVRRSRLALSNRMVGCGSQRRRAPSPSCSPTLISVASAERAIDLLGGRRRDGRLAAGRQRHLDVDAVAAGQPARRIEQHGLGAAPPAGLGKRTRAAPAWRSVPRRVCAAAPDEAEAHRAFRPRQPGPGLKHPALP